MYKHRFIQWNYFNLFKKQIFSVLYLKPITIYFQNQFIKNIYIIYNKSMYIMYVGNIFIIWVLYYN